MAQITAYLEVCESAARAAGHAIQQWVGKTTIRHKGPADLVTEADFAAQEVVKKTVLAAFPQHSVLGEEDQIAGNTPSATEFRWIVDPLDGTTNFVHGVPHYAVSLALEHRGRILVGTVYDPSMDDCFTTAEGRGAFLNGEPIRTSDIVQLSAALAATGFPAYVQPDSPDLLVFNKAIFDCQGVRRTGSASLNLCYVAAGRFDVVWGFSTKIWDIAAGVLLIREAGGVVSSLDGGELDLASGRFLASANGELHHHLVGLVQDAL